MMLVNVLVEESAKEAALKLAPFMFLVSQLSPKTTGGQLKVKSTPKAYALYLCSIYASFF